MYIPRKQDLLNAQKVKYSQEIDKAIQLMVDKMVQGHFKHTAKYVGKVFELEHPAAKQLFQTEAIKRFKESGWILTFTAVKDDDQFAYNITEDDTTTVEEIIPQYSKY